MELTPASQEVFMKYAKDAHNWSGEPWVSAGNVKCTEAMKGNLSDLVKKGLIEIEEPFGDGQTCVIYTALGIAYAESLNINLWGI